MSTDKLTLEQIAKLSGVSRSTVSRVVNDHVNVKPQVRQRVLEMIAQTGYRPDPAARSLAGQRSGIIGLVIPRAVQFLFTDPYYPHLMQGIAQACNTHDYILSLFLFDTQDEEQKLLARISRNRLVDGLIVSASPLNDPLIPQLVEHKLPFVMIGRPGTPDSISFVDVDNVAGAYNAVSHLIRLGRHRIATISGPLNTAVGHDRQQGYLKALHERSYTFDKSLMYEGDFTEMSGYIGMQHLLTHRPDAVVVASDTMALGALRGLRLAGITVPNEIAIIGFDDLPAAAISDPPLTTVRQPIRQVGTQAIETMIDILKNGAEPSRCIVMPTELVIRNSCGSTLYSN